VPRAGSVPAELDAWKQDATWLFEQMIVTTGARPLGIEAAHLIELANWLKRQGAPKVRLETSGMRNQVVALVAAALEPNLFSEVKITHGIPSLRYLVDKPVKYQDAAELFCLDLYKFTDLDRLAALNAPTVGGRREETNWKLNLLKRRGSYFLRCLSNQRHCFRKVLRGK